tara:strand:+ start:39102 stop:40256 length:1155 start_codon:yes stop_codon:yes gene_type:complete
MLRRICFVIGSRANYSSIKSVMTAVKIDRKLTFQLILSTSSVLQRYGDVSDVIEKDGFKVNEKIFNLIEGETPLTMAKSTGLCLIELSSIFSRLKPDLVFAVGDRFEVMAVVLAASYMNIPIAHTMGGEVTGTIDESIRHAITKFSHIHFPATKEAAKRIQKLGEEKSKIFYVGCPRIDYVKEVLSKKRIYNKNILSQGVGIKFDINKPFIILSYHPVTTEFEKIDLQTRQILDCVNTLDIPTIILWPNADAGSSKIAKLFRVYRENKLLKKAHFYKNLPTDLYINLLDKCLCIVGNSSSGIREGNYLGVPCVNIGSRQNSRERGRNVINVPFEKKKIINAIKVQIKNGKYKEGKLYGDGTASQKIISVLKNVSSIKIQKQITY